MRSIFYRGIQNVFCGRCHITLFLSPPTSLVWLGFNTLVYEPFTHFWLRGCDVFEGDHFTLSAQYAADIGPRAMFFE